MNQLTVDDKIRFFFEEPHIGLEQHKQDGITSVLYLLRRELVETAGFNPDTDKESEVAKKGIKNRLFASLILMFSAVDLLAKFMLGDKGGPGERFKAFLKSSDGGQMLAQNADLLYAIRNSLVHAFGLPDEDGLAKLGLKGVSLGQRKLTENPEWPGLISVESDGDIAVVYIDGVFRILLNCISRYLETLYGSASGPVRVKFEAAFDKYGKIRIG